MESSQGHERSCEMAGLFLLDKIATFINTCQPQTTEFIELFSGLRDFTRRYKGKKPLERQRKGRKYENKKRWEPTHSGSHLAKMSRARFELATTALKVRCSAN
jgi:hypothetical protein